MKSKKIISRQEQARKRGLARTMIEIPADCLEKLDAMALRKDISRASLIRSVLSDFTKTKRVVTKLEVADDRTNLFD